MGAAAASALVPAPLHEDVAEAPDGGAAYWLTTADGTRIRIGLWSPESARGTVLMFPGRTEFIEKYGRLAGDLTAAGLAMLAVDWRGQGLADRPAFRRDIGHVESFAEYGLDVDAVMAALAQLAPPKPWYLLGHSMGGAIGLRALHGGLPVARAVFSAPMWGISMSFGGRVMAGVLNHLAPILGLDRRFAPSTGPAGPMAFAGNRLTTDPDQFAYMENQTDTYPELALGGPSIRWLCAALAETAELMTLAPPDIPALCFIGTAEKIVDPAAVKTYMARWPGGALDILDGAEHEVLMEAPRYRQPILERTLAFLAQV